MDNKVKAVVEAAINTLTCKCCWNGKQSAPSCEWREHYIKSPEAVKAKMPCKQLEAALTALGEGDG